MPLTTKTPTRRKPAPRREGERVTLHLHPEELRVLRLQMAEAGARQVSAYIVARLGLSAKPGDAQ